MGWSCYISPKANNDSSRPRPQALAGKRGKRTFAPTANLISQPAQTVVSTQTLWDNEHRRAVQHNHLLYQSVNTDGVIGFNYNVRFYEVNSVALGLAAKKEIVAEVSDVASRALSVAVAEYRGMEVAELTALRVKAREQGVYLKVVRNTLAKRALAESKFADLDSALTGPLIYGFSLEAPGGAARLFKDFQKENKKLQVTALSIGSGLLGPDKLDAVAALPTRDEALARLLATFKAPVGKFVQTINEVPAKFVRVLAAVKDTK